MDDLDEIKNVDSAVLKEQKGERTEITSKKEQ